MTKVKQQHYVPRFYLRRFADEREQIHVYDKKEMRAFITNIHNVAAEGAFLDVPQIETNPQFMEKEYLAAFEREGAEALRVLIESVEVGAFRHLRGKRRVHLARFMAVQSLRTREHREAISDLAGLAYEANLRAHLENVSPEEANEPFNVRPDTESERIIHVENLLNLPLIDQITGALLAHIWQVYRTPANSPFWTSDNPVVRHGHIKDPHQGMDGFASRGVEVAYPITPRLLVSAAEATHFHMVAPRQGRLSELLRDNVTFYNSLQVMHSWRFVFSASADFGLAEAMCKERPYLRDPDRQRIEVSGGPWSNLGGRSDSVKY